MMSSVRCGRAETGGKHAVPERLTTTQFCAVCKTDVIQPAVFTLQFDIKQSIANNQQYKSKSVF